LLDLPTSAQKCDEQHPLCGACATLHITCFYDEDKPEWMGGGVRQEEMAERLKRKVKENAHRRIPSNRILPIEVTIDESRVISQRLSSYLAPRKCHLLSANPATCNDATEWFQRGTDCTLTTKDARETIAFGNPTRYFSCSILINNFPSYSRSTCLLSLKVVEHGS
jgi:hypothetical protein